MTPPLNSSRTSKHIKHLGPRPKNDQDNHCREKLCRLIKDVGCFYEIYPERLYLVYLAKGERQEDLFDSIDVQTCPFIFWSSRETPAPTYESFNMDFGPFNLGVTHQFCSKLKVWLDTQPYRNPDKTLVIVLDDANTEMKLNTTLLVAIAGMVLLNLTDDEVLQRLNFFMMYKGKAGEPCKQLIFREKKKFLDVSGNHSLMALTLDDCIRSFYAALQYKFYDYYQFDHIEYLFYETVISGDLNWIVPGKILAFAGPSDHSNYNKHTPAFYYGYFKDHNVSSIVRLNDPEYDSSEFTRLGFQHHDLIFPDGYPPTSTIAAKFIKIVDEARGAVAVHCYAGIGRTGTLIAAYLMARYNFTTQMAVAWTRICRPGSVIGEQQDWLYTKFDPMSPTNQTTGKQAKSRKSAPASSIMSTSGAISKAANTTYVEAEKIHGQAKALLLKKKQFTDRPRTRSQPAQLKLNSVYGDSSTSSDKETAATSVTKRDDVVLDLGKTVPFKLYLRDLLPLKGKKNPEFYRLKEGNYEWKVKFPQSDYVAFRHHYERDLQLLDDETETTPECTSREPFLDFKYEKDSSPIDNKSPIESSVPRLKPIVYYQLNYWL